MNACTTDRQRRYFWQSHSPLLFHKRQTNGQSEQHQFVTAQPHLYYNYRLTIPLRPFPFPTSATGEGVIKFDDIMIITWPPPLQGLQFFLHSRPAWFPSAVSINGSRGRWWWTARRWRKGLPPQSSLSVCPFQPPLSSSKPQRRGWGTIW